MSQSELLSISDPPARVQIRLKINGEEHQLSFAPYKTLLELLGEDVDEKSWADGTPKFQRR